MRDVQTLLARCRELGATFAPGPDGKLKVRVPAPLPAELREALRQRKAEVLALLTQTQATLWPCRHCGNLAEIEDVCPSLDGTRTLTLWHCSPCQTWGVTPSMLREPPVWVSSKEQ